MYFFNNYKHTHIHFLQRKSVIVAGILRAGKKHFLGNVAVRFVCRMRSSHSACAQRIPHQLPSQMGPLPRIHFFM